MFIISIISFFILALVNADDWATYPQVPKTASINGFADPIIDLLPDCAKDCVKFSVNNTPCPYWDTGCFCVMPQWAGLVGQCIAQNCKGDDVQSAVYLATSLCSTVGANTWMMPASISTMLTSAAGNAREVTTITDKTAMSWVIESASSGANTVSSTGASTAATSTASSSAASNTGSASSSTSATTNTSSTSNMAILQTGSVGTIIFGFLVSLII